MSTKPIYREAYRQTHKLLGTWLALWAWQKGLDCVILRRPELLSFLRMTNLTRKHIRWLEEDVRHLFPSTRRKRSKKTDTVLALHLSRVTRADRSLAVTEIPTKEDMVRTMACVMQGIVDFPNSPPKPHGPQDATPSLYEEQ